MQTQTKANERFELPADDMAFRKIYLELLEQEALTVVFRPGSRDCGQFRGYCPGEIVNARVIDQLGLDRAQTAPTFLASPVKKIRIEEVTVRSLGSLSWEDFVGAPPYVRDPWALRHQLGLIYNLEPSSLSDEAKVTRIRFSFIH